MDDAKFSVGPSRRWYLLAVGLVLVAGALFWLTVDRANERFAEVFAGMQRVVMPGEHALQLDKPGQYQVYYERRSEVDGRVFETADQPPDIRLTLEREGGETVEVTAAKELGVYNRGTYQGTGVWQFTIQKPGKHVLTGRYPADATRTPQIALAIDDDELKATYQQAMGLPLAVAGILGVAALVMVLITFAARLQAKARAAEGGTAAANGRR